MKQYFISGTLVGVLIWVIITICDAIDEYILKQETLIGADACIIVPLILSIIYIIIYIKKQAVTYKNIFMVCRIYAMQYYIGIYYMLYGQ